MGPRFGFFMFNSMADVVLDITQETFNVEGGGDYRPQKGGSYNVRVIKHAAFEEVVNNSDVTFSSTKPAATVKLKDLPYPPEKKDRIIIENIVFEVMDEQPDDMGGSMLVLRKVIN